jgi:hypothetical protein
LTKRTVRTHRLVIAYQEDVARRVGALAYRLNLNFADVFRNICLAVTVRGREAEAAKAPPRSISCCQVGAI